MYGSGVTSVAAVVTRVFLSGLQLCPRPWHGEAYSARRWRASEAQKVTRFGEAEKDVANVCKCSMQLSYHMGFPWISMMYLSCPFVQPYKKLNKFKPFL